MIQSLWPSFSLPLCRLPKSVLKSNCSVSNEISGHSPSLLSLVVSFHLNLTNPLYDFHIEHEHMLGKEIHKLITPVVLLSIA